MQIAIPEGDVVCKERRRVLHISPLPIAQGSRTLLALFRYLRYRRKKDVLHRVYFPGVFEVAEASDGGVSLNVYSSGAFYYGRPSSTDDGDVGMGARHDPTARQYVGNAAHSLQASSR